ncbi:MULTISPECIES: caspase family protein [Bradyrhizobium]|uniref:Peptidoglycan binding domain-containing protein n=2 Tax=Bradyrhizobium TaxID=374 RepID=A0ABY0QGV8_9BRAD|nr:MULTISPECIES: caspase family protein [Bradyrhizobium]SDK34233.1 Putative peptidoglycan binding domain-containing protein [Bradyrhizobium ottawaense]SEE38203.1 Putative peptidoglycan binding domain-containing protein [Bradyrhizobium lablabi]
MRLLIIALSVIGILASSNVANAERRVAFVVGNGAYKNVAPLPNPSIDARSMATVLRKVGFDVVEGTNLTRDQMTERLLEFGDKAQGAELAVFFYAGHGIAISGTNYLLPVDADVKSEMDVKLGSAINVDVTLDQTMRDAKVKLVFLDACRDNPFAAKIRSSATSRSVNVQRGLAEMKSGEGTLIAFATGPGQTALDGKEGTNSPFTRALIDNITKPGVEIQQAMTQVRAQVNEETNKGQLPWGHTNLIGSVYLNPAAARPAASAAEAPKTPVFSTSAASDVELEFWRSIKDSNKPEELDAYVTNYPNGQFKSLALARIASLQDGSSTTTTRNLTKGIDPATFTDEATLLTEDQIGLDKGQRRDVQRQLTGLGFDTKVSGKFDDSTRAVIRRWQAARGYPSSGFLNRLQHKALLSEIVATVDASASDDSGDRRSRPHHSGGGGHHYRGGGGGGGGPGPGPGGLLGGMMGGLFGRR